MKSRTTPPDELPRQLDLLEKLHGTQPLPPPRGALEWILWENAAYLVPDEQRLACFRALKKRAGSSGKAILRAPREALLALAEQGGMLPEQRVGKWIEIATLVQEDFAGDLESALDLPLPKARAALKRFPGIGDPGAEKILLFTGKHALFALESNGLRTLVRLGYAPDQSSYSSTYRSMRSALASLESLGTKFLQRAHLLLRLHGQELCKHSAPFCDRCPLSDRCPAAS